MNRQPCGCATDIPMNMWCASLQPFEMCDAYVLPTYDATKCNAMCTYGLQPVTIESDRASHELRTNLRHVKSEKNM